ncbi:hypothetical protein Asera_16930 [Actinocatenispora sera]|uniref:Uncharacterized protein n=1 Tax=Actinocatenispora sera TaxID=390989 RepID=A0A810KY24_9ACTN|nr:hypothetical protein Asera_16930 [Actinocatenispora sera]
MPADVPINDVQRIMAARASRDHAGPGHARVAGPSTEVCADFLLTGEPSLAPETPRAHPKMGSELP